MAENSKPANTCGVLIIGGAHGSLALARSFGRHGIPAWFVTNDHPIAKYSRYTKRSFSWRGPDDEGAVEFLLRLAGRHGLIGWMLIPGGDAELRLISQHRAALSAAFRVCVPRWETVRFGYDKRFTYERAQSLGIDYPLCYHPRDLQEVARLDYRFPVVLKPAGHEKKNAFTQAKAWRVNDRTELLARYRQAAELVGERNVVLQEMIPGSGSAQFSYAGVWHDGAPVASIVARRARQYPIEFGYTSTFVESVERPEVEDASCRFLQSLDYSGLAEAEFKFDERDGHYKLLDVNMRPWTWNGLGTRAGVDFPYILWRLAMGETVPPMRGRTGVAWMHGSRDVVAAFEEIRIGRLTLADYLRSIRQPLVFAAFAADDPLPGLIDVPLQALRLLVQRVPKAAREICEAYGSRLCTNR